MFRMAFRNLFRNKRRTIITLLSIVFAAFLISFMRFFTYGVHQESIKQAVGLSTGYLQVAAYGWIESGHSLERAMDYTPEIRKTILSVPGVTGVSRRIRSGALVSYHDSSKFVDVLGFDPVDEKKVTDLQDYVISGTFLSESYSPEQPASGKPIVYEGMIGYKLADYLGVKPGSELSLVSSQFDGSVGAILFRVTGILRANHSRLDSNQIWIHLKTAERLFGPGDPANHVVRYTSLAIGTKNIFTAEDVERKLKQIYPSPKTAEAPEDSDVYDPVALGWRDLNRDLIQYLTLDQIGNEVTYIFLLIIMAFGVLATVEMSVYERTREFGILLALGTRSGQIVTMVMLEVVMLLGIGIFIGIGIGAALGYYYDVNPIILSGETADMYVEFGSVVTMRAMVNFQETYIAVLSLALPSILFSYMATRRVHHLKPAEIINVL